MSFEDVLLRRLGAFRSAIDRPAIDPAALYYRRAAGVEVNVRPDASFAEMSLCAPGSAPRVWPWDAALELFGATTWKHASEFTLSPRDLWRAVDHDLLYYAARDPGVSLPGRGGVLALAGENRIALRRSVWPTPAIERELRVENFPFMPRGTELRHAVFAGIRLGDHERGFEIGAATICGNAETASVMRRLISLLDGSRSARQVLDVFQDRAERACAEWILPLLDALAFLETSAGPGGVAALDLRSDSDLAPSSGSRRVTWLGHAAVLLELEGKNVLVDPLFFAASEPPERWLSAPKPDPRALPPIDLVLITHGDNDHLNPSALLHVPPHVPIIVPSVATPAPAHQVDLLGTLRLLGFTRVIQLAAWESHELDGIRITACPFDGEDWNLNLAQATYLVESPSTAVFFSADAFRMDETYRRIVALRESPIDLAFMGVSGCAESLAAPKELGYGNFYRAFIPRERHNEWVQHCAGSEDALASLEILRPRLAFGYAAGGASFIETAYSDRGDHHQLAELLAARCGSTSAIDLSIGVATRF